MKAIFRSFLLLAFLIAGSYSHLPAQDAGPARVAGRVLLLQSERALEGDIEKIGEQYRIRRGTSEVWLPTEKAERLCADWDDAYAFMKSRANLGDPEERLRLARWCQLNNLRSQALTEAKAALELRPSHEESRQLVALLTRSVATLQSAQVKPATSAQILPAQIPADINSDTFALFATRVQPILMNTCVNCHGGRTGGFQLIRTEGGQRHSTKANLDAVLAQVQVDHAAVSPLLLKAVSAHGNAVQAPIKDRQSLPYKTLEAWIDYLLTTNPHLKYRDAAASGPKTPAEPLAFAQSQFLPPPRNKVVSQSTPRREEMAPSPTNKNKTDTPSAAPITAGAEEQHEPPAIIVDPFDPALFNRQVHSKK